MSTYSVVRAENTVAPHVNNIIPGGQVTLLGQVMSGGCLVSVSNTDKFVQMGEVTRNQFSGVGSDASAVPFSIQLDECSSNVSESVAIAFTGIVNRQDLQVLAITPGPSAAEGIGVAIFDAQNRLLPINSMPNDFFLLHNGVNTLHFLAKYRLTQQNLVPGVADARADFTLIYQ